MFTALLFAHCRVTYACTMALLCLLTTAALLPSSVALLKSKRRTLDVLLCLPTSVVRALGKEALARAEREGGCEEDGSDCGGQHEGIDLGADDDADKDGDPLTHCDQSHATGRGRRRDSCAEGAEATNNVVNNHHRRSRSQSQSKGERRTSSGSRSPHHKAAGAGRRGSAA